MDEQGDKEEDDNEGQIEDHQEDKEDNDNCDPEKLPAQNKRKEGNQAAKELMRVQRMRMRTQRLHLACR